MPTSMNKKMAKDDTALCRPKGVFTDEERERRKSEGTTRRATVNFNPQQRAEALAQAYDRDGNLKTQVKEWTPKSLSDGTYGSEAMRELCEEFGNLAADIVQDFKGGK